VVLSREGKTQGNPGAKSELNKYRPIISGSGRPKNTRKNHLEKTFHQMD